MWAKTNALCRALQSNANRGFLNLDQLVVSFKMNVFRNCFQLLVAHLIQLFRMTLENVDELSEPDPQLVCQCTFDSKKVSSFVLLTAELPRRANAHQRESDLQQGYLVAPATIRPIPNSLVVRRPPSFRSLATWQSEAWSALGRQLAGR